MEVTFNYKTDGTLFSKPIEGEGPAEVQIKNIQMYMNMHFEIIEKDGNKYFDLKDFDISYNIRGMAEFTFSNLYYGDKEQSDTMHSLINENWKDFIAEFGMFFFSEFGASLFKVFKDYDLDTPIRSSSSC
ncbi:uncharacterized protein LOC123658748 [Melitaea cinxia]|uniref:uncharacterized protein LOC123658748 n=1 Tax=Melitaea cinxia TaxID=113334 RepID=UPI001E26F638|nr:uncharacterized protein LOC123658748 [Melitaea cinxia]